MSELQLLTFWLTHLYCRCTRSVAVATPGTICHYSILKWNLTFNCFRLCCVVTLQHTTRTGQLVAVQCWWMQGSVGEIWRQCRMLGLRQTCLHLCISSDRNSSFRSSSNRCSYTNGKHTCEEYSCARWLKNMCFYVEATDFMQNNSFYIIFYK